MRAPARGPEPCYPRALDKSQEVCFVPINDAKSLGAGRHGSAFAPVLRPHGPLPAASYSSDLKNSSRAAGLGVLGTAGASRGSQASRTVYLAVPLTPWQLQRAAERTAAELRDALGAAAATHGVLPRPRAGPLTVSRPIREAGPPADSRCCRRPRPQGVPRPRLQIRRCSPR